MTCHGSSGTGANTNVNDGKYMARNPNVNGTTSTAVNADLIAGGFTTYKGSPVTSRHDVISETITSAWGISGTNRGALGTMSGGALRCSSCHNPHGSPNYRMMNTTINSVAISVTLTDEGSAKNYGAEHWSADISTACDGCHKSYHVTSSGSASDPAVAVNGGFTHRVDRTTSKASYLATTGISMRGGVTVTLPFASQYVTSTLTADDKMIVCETCHLVHGSSSLMSGFANGGPTLSGVQPGNTTSGDSALLRADNRGVCEACHQK